MGQSASSQRDREENIQHDSRRSLHPVQDSESRNTVESDSLSSSLARHSQQLEGQPTQPFATFSRQISAQSIPVRGSVANNGNAQDRDEIFYEQQEVRPLVHMEDLGMRNARITHITASPMPRRHSVISRLSSRLLPRYSTNSSLGNDQESQSEGRSTRRRLSNRLPPGTPDGSFEASHNRFSLFSPLSPGSSTPSRSRRRRELASISRSYPILADGSLQPPNFGGSVLGGSSPETPSRGHQDSTIETTNSSIRNSRLSRVRRSLSIPLESLLSPARAQPSQDTNVPSLPRRPLRGATTDESIYSLPPLSAPDPNIGLNNSTLEPSRSNQGISGFPAVAGPSESSPGWAEGPSWTERWAERGSTSRREARRMPNMLRGRSSRLVRRDEDGPLRRILDLAATLIAAQLSGTSEQDITNMQAIGADGPDGSLSSLFRALQHATTSAGEERSPDGGSEAVRPPGTLPPLNFLQVFRFVNQNSDVGTTSRSRAQDRSPPSTLNEDNSDSADGRTVTLVVVGVRSVPPEHITHEDASVAEPALDTLLNLPVAPSNNILRSGTSGLLRHADGRPRFPHLRRASMGGVNTFPANYDSQRHQRMLIPGRQGSIDTTSAGASTASAFSESPPGPHPPPSTPADPGLSAYPSGATTPNRRPSSASAVQHPPLPSRDVTINHLHDTGILAAGDQITRTVQQRRRSDSEFARHRDLGAGAARRNGIVNLDDVEPGDPPSQVGRSWLIYVVGTNLSEDHPAFATPSLFTDVSHRMDPWHRNSNFCLQNPTYEDMLLLSSLLGPAKPPVASREDVASTLGVHRVQRAASGLIAQALNGDAPISIASGERCLVCLCEYEPEEQIRQLTKCTHFFHRECIDEVRCSLKFEVEFILTMRNNSG